MKKFIVGVLVMCGVIGGTFGFYQNSNANSNEVAGMRMMRF